MRFGVLAPTSMVARLAVMPAIRRFDGSEITAVASLSAAPGSVPQVPPEARWLSSYEDVLADDRVDAIYVPLPNSLHREWVERAAAAGKHVLCEKPLGCSAEEAESMARSAEQHGVVLMEAYMTPFHPRSKRVGEICGERIGEFRFGTASFTGRLERAHDHRWSPKMGGGALLDVGIYCLEPLLEAAGMRGAAEFGGPVAGCARPGGDGVDASFSGFLELGGGGSLSFQCSFEAPERQRLELVGSDGAVLVERAFTPSYDDREILFRDHRGALEIVTTEGADPYLLMVEHFCRVTAGDCEPFRPASRSVALARLLDRLALSAASGGASP